MKCRRASVGLFVALIVFAVGAIVTRQISADRPPPASLARASAVSLLAWLPAEPVMPQALHEHDPRYPAMLLDHATGISHLAWEEGGDVRYAWRDGGDWIVDETAWRGDSVVLALGPSGEPHLVYVDVSPVDAQLQVFHVQRHEGVWSLPQNVSSTLGPSTAPDVSMAISSDIHILWSERLDRSNRIYHAFSGDGGVTWSQVAPIPQALGFAPVLAAGQGNVMWAAWQGANSDLETSDIWVARWDGQNWSAPESISESVSGSSRLPDLLIADDGSLRAAWEQELFAGVPIIMYREGRPSEWRPPLILSQGQGTRPRLSLTTQGFAAAAWDAGDHVAIKCQDAEGSFGDMTTIGLDTIGIRDVAISPSSSGNVDVAWCTISEDGPGALWFATQLREVTATPSPSITATPTPLPSPTKTTTPTSAPTLVETLPKPTSTVTPSEAATLPAPTSSPTPSSQPTIPVPTRYLPYNTYFPAIEKPVDLPQGPLILSEPRRLLRPEARPHIPDDSPAPKVAHDPWRWYGVSNVSASATPSRDASVVWLAGTQALAVWAEEYPAFSLLAYSVLENGVWSAATPFYVGESPDLAVDDNGTAHLVFSNEHSGAYDIFYATWRGGQWTPSQNISHTSGNSSQPAIAIADDGRPLVVWSDTTQNSHRIYHGWLENGLWSTYLIHGSIGGSAPDIAASKDSRVWVSWQALEPWGTYEVYAAWGDGVTWQNFAILVSGIEMVDSIAPRLAASKLRGACIVWQENEQPASAVHYANNTIDNYWWDVPSPLTVGRGSAVQPDLAVHTSGQLFVAWQEGDAVAMTSRYPSVTTWLSPTVMSDGGASLAAPHIAADDSSRLLTLWSASPSGGISDIHGQQGLFQPPYGVWLSSIYTADAQLAQATSDR